MNLPQRVAVIVLNTHTHTHTHTHMHALTQTDNKCHNLRLKVGNKIVKGAHEITHETATKTSKAAIVFVLAAA